MVNIKLLSLNRALISWVVWVFGALARRARIRAEVCLSQAYWTLETDLRIRGKFTVKNNNHSPPFGESYDSWPRIRRLWASVWTSHYEDHELAALHRCLRSNKWRSNKPRGLHSAFSQQISRELSGVLNPRFGFKLWISKHSILECVSLHSHTITDTWSLNMFTHKHTTFEPPAKWFEFITQFYATPAGSLNENRFVDSANTPNSQSSANFVSIDLPFFTIEDKMFVSRKRL